MKKQSIIMLCCVSFLLIVSVGYALLGNTIEIDNEQVLFDVLPIKSDSIEYWDEEIINSKEFQEQIQELKTTKILIKNIVNFYELIKSKENQNENNQKNHKKIIKQNGNKVPITDLMRKERKKNRINTGY